MSKLAALRAAPQSVEAEQAVLGGIMLAEDSMAKLGGILTSKDFYRRDHQLIYLAIEELTSHSPPSPIDPVTMGEWFEANGLMDQVNPGYLIQLSSTTPSAANIMAYAEIVVEYSRLRQMIEIGTGMVNEAFTPKGAGAFDIAAKYQTLLAMVMPSKLNTGPLIIKASMKEWWNRLVARYEAGNRMTGLPTPWQGVNSVTRGLQDSELYILAGRPSMGKSVAAGQLTSFTSLRGDNTLLFSIESSTDSIHNRNVACLADVPYDYMKAPTPEDDPDDLYFGKISVALKQLRDAPLYIDESPGLTIDQLCARARRQHMKTPLRLVVVDHIHTMKIPGKDPVREYGEIARQLKALAKELKCPVVAVAQLNRALASRTDKRPVMSDLRASGEIEQEADVIIFVHREDYYDTPDKKTHLQKVVEFIFAKGRDIESGKKVNLKNRYDQMRTEDWSGEFPTMYVEDDSDKKNRWKHQKNNAYKD